MGLKHVSNHYRQFLNLPKIFKINRFLMVVFKMNPTMNKLIKNFKPTNSEKFRNVKPLLNFRVFYKRKWSLCFLDKNNFLKFQQKWPSTCHFSDRPSANVGKFWTFAKCIEWYTNRRRILCWVQKCITLYHYFGCLVSYGILKVKFIFLGGMTTNLTYKMP